MRPITSHFIDDKISLSKIVRASLPSFNERAIPCLPNHISWEEDRPLKNRQENQRKSNITFASNGTTKRRKKIFGDKEKEEGKSRDKSRQVRFQVSQPKIEQDENKLRKVKSSTKLPKNISKDEVTIKLREINRQLQEYRSSRASIAQANSQRKKSHQKQQLSKLQQKLTQSTILMRRQQQLLHAKMPSFEQKLDNNSYAISEMSSLLQSKIDENNQNVSRMMQMAVQNESRLKIKDQEMLKINSSLIHKEMELMKNKEENKKHQLQLIRLKRIQDLQNHNLQLYQALSKQGLKNFQSLARSQMQNMVQGQQWNDEDTPVASKFTYKQQSTIRYPTHYGLNSSRSQDNTINQILSPLAFNEQGRY